MFSGASFQVVKVRDNKGKTMYIWYSMISSHADLTRITEEAAGQRYPEASSKAQNIVNPPFFLVFWPHHAACRMVAQTQASTVKVLNPNH